MRTTIMELKLCTDLIDALGKVAGGLNAIVNLPNLRTAPLVLSLGERIRTDSHHPRRPKPATTTSQSRRASPNLID